MRTPILLWLLLDVAALPAFAQAPTAADPMRVDPAMQRQRDQDRQRILQDELATEARELAAAQNELRDAQSAQASGDKLDDIASRIATHQQNVAALQREIGLSQRQSDAAPARVERQPDNWLIVGQRLIMAAPRPDRVDFTARRKLTGTAPQRETLPAWIIPTGAPAQDDPTRQ